MRRREHEAEPAFGQAALDRLRRCVDGDTERVEHVGRARAGGDGTVAVLGDRHAGTRHDESGAGGNVVGALGVAARAAGIDGTLRRAHRNCPRPHGARRARDLIHGLATQPQSHEKRADLRRGRRPRHYALERFGGFLLGEGGARRQFGDGCAEVGERCRSWRARARGHRPLLAGRLPARAARPGQGRGSLRAADGRAPRRCSRGETARHARGSACAARP